MSVFILLINVIVIKYVRETLILLLSVEICDMRVAIYNLIKYQEKENLQLGRYLISWLFNLAISRFWNIWRVQKFLKMVKNRENSEI